MAASLKDEARLLITNLGEALERRVPHTDEGIVAANFDRSELGVLEGAPSTDDATSIVLRVPLRHAEDVGALHPVFVVLDEGALHLEADLLEEIPKFADEADRASLDVGEVRAVAAERLLGLVGELLVAAHGRIARDLVAPLLEESEDGGVVRIHLRVGLVAERADVDAAERVVGDPREDVRVADGELGHCARFGLARRVGAGAGLDRLGLPARGEVPVHVGLGVAHERWLRHVEAVEAFDEALRVDAVERPFVLDTTREEEAGALFRFGEVAAHVAAAHEERLAVAVDIVAAPECVRLSEPVIARVRPNEMVAIDHAFGAIGAHARQHVEENVGADERCDVRGQIAKLRAFVGVDAKEILDEAEAHARAGELARVDVPVDPHGGPNAIRCVADRHDPEVAALFALPDARESHHAGERGRPTLELRRQVRVAEIALAKAAVEVRWLAA